MIATGLTYIIITAGIDLSVGSVLVFSGVISAKVMNSVGGDNWGVIIVGLVVALLAGTAWGLLNGFLVAKAKIPPFIVTLGTLGMALGSALLITGGVDEREVAVQADRDDRLRPAVRPDPVPGDHRRGGRADRRRSCSPRPGSAATRTRSGPTMEGARRAGVNVDRHLIKIYALGGTLAGLAGFLSLARFGTTSIGGHSTDNLDAIAAIVIGGTSLFGGVGTILGTVVGVFIPAVLRNGFVIVGVQPFWQQVAVGAVLIAAVYFDQLRRARYAR